MYSQVAFCGSIVIVDFIGLSNYNYCMVRFKACAIVGDSKVYPDDKMCREVTLLLNKLINEKQFNVFYVAPQGPFEWMVRNLLSELEQGRYPFITTYLMEPYDDFNGAGSDNIMFDTELTAKVKAAHPMHRPTEFECKCAGIDKSEFVIFAFGGEEFKEEYIEHAKKQNKEYVVFLNNEEE